MKNDYLKKREEIINKYLKKYISKYNKVGLVGKAINYSVFAGGKRVRPILMLAIAEMLGADFKKIVPSACAIECIHTFSLIHDDLPAMDNDDYRRGKLTAHKKFGEANAILAGDALHSLAYQIMIENTPKNVKSVVIIEAIRVLAKTIGIEGVVNGQQLDLKYENKRISLRQLKQIHLLKTAELIKASALIAAMLSTNNRNIINKIGRFGEHLGLTFQIIDDILDEVGEFKKIGKKPGSDRNKNKSTYVKLLGIDKAKNMAGEEEKQALKILSSFGRKANKLISLTKLLTSRNN